MSASYQFAVAVLAGIIFLCATSALSPDSPDPERQSERFGAAIIGMVFVMVLVAVIL